MKADGVKELLEKVRSRQMSIDQAMDVLGFLPFADFGEIKLDLHREMRTGVPEAIYAPGKTIEQIMQIVQQGNIDGPLFITKVDSSLHESIQHIIPVTYYAKAQLIVMGKIVSPSGRTGDIVVITAGTGDIPIAEEAAVTAEVLGVRVVRIHDVGAAGIHRLLSFRDTIKKATVAIVTAGMDGILPCIVASLFATPVIALPTSVGYGTGMQGYAALLSMLNSCAPGVAVVNIDNGYGAGVMAYKITCQIAKSHETPKSSNH